MSPERETGTESGSSTGAGLLAAADARTGTWKRQAAALAFCAVIAALTLTQPSGTLNQDGRIGALLISGALAVIARGIGSVSNSGAFAGWAIAFVIYDQYGRAGFITLFLVFALTWLATRAGYWRKQRMGLAERRSGRRASQLVANLGAAGGLVTASHWLGDTAGWLAVAALSEAAADTVASEVGQAYGSGTRLVTNLRPVPPGTNGGVSPQGTLAAAAAAFVVAAWPLSAFIFSQPGLAAMLPAALLFTAVAMAGMLVDSLLGATLERRGWLNNDAVNLLGTSSAALLLAGWIWMVN